MYYVIQWKNGPVQVVDSVNVDDLADDWHRVYSVNRQTGSVEGNWYP
jgi:hypothetical protein